MDVHVWLLVRKQCGRPDLTRVGNYVLASSQDRRDFEKFRDTEFYKERPLIKTDLLVQFMEMNKLSIEYCSKFGIDFITNFPSSQYANLCEWTRHLLFSSKVSDEGDNVKCKKNAYHTAPNFRGL